MTELKNKEPKNGIKNHFSITKRSLGQYGYKINYCVQRTFLKCTSKRYFVTFTDCTEKSTSFDTDFFF